jgi:hypothetical protein
LVGEEACSRKRTIDMDQRLATADDPLLSVDRKARRGGCFSTLLVFVLLWAVLGQCDVFR